MIVLDATVLIAHLEASNLHHHRATALMVDVADEPFGISPITLAEVLVGPARLGKLNAAHKAIRELGVATVALSDDAPGRLAMLRANTRLRLPDCCVLLAAETGRAEVATFDDRLAASATDLGMSVRS